METVIPIMIHESTKAVRLKEDIRIKLKPVFEAKGLDIEESYIYSLCLVKKKDTKGYFYIASLVLNNSNSPAPLQDVGVYELDQLDGLKEFLSFPSVTFEETEKNVLLFEGKEMTGEEFEKVGLEWHKTLFPTSA